MPFKTTVQREFGNFTIVDYVQTLIFVFRRKKLAIWQLVDARVPDYPITRPENELPEPTRTWFLYFG